MSQECRFAFKQLDVYAAAVEHFRWCVTTIAGMSHPPFMVTDRVLRASLSTMASIGEASGRWKRPGESEQHYRYAQASTYESAAFLDVLASMGAVDDDHVYNAREQHLARMAKMLTPLMHGSARRRSRTSFPR